MFLRLSDRRGGGEEWGVSRTDWWQCRGSQPNQVEGVAAILESRRNHRQAATFGGKDGTPSTVALLGRV